MVAYWEDNLLSTSIIIQHVHRISHRWVSNTVWAKASRGKGEPPRRENCHVQILPLSCISLSAGKKTRQAAQFSSHLAKRKEEELISVPDVFTGTDPRLCSYETGRKCPGPKKRVRGRERTPSFPLFLPSLLSLGAMTDGHKPREGRNDGREGMGVAVWKVHASAVVLSSSPVFLLRMSGTHFPKAES